MKRIITLFTAVGLTCASLSAKVVRDYESNSDNVLTFKVDSIDYRTDLTRVYGKILGRPHTSGRIDEVRYVANEAAAVSNDIDGVDFRRYFQWEEDGQIPLEIDFPALRPAAAVQLIFVTSRGNSTTTAKNTVKKHK